MVKKSFVIKCGSKCKELVSRISEEGIRFSSVEIIGDTLRIYFSEDILSPEIEIQEIKKIMAEILPPKHSTRKIEISRIQRSVGPIIPDVLAEILSLQGYEAKYINNRIETNATYETLIEIASRVSRCIKELEFVRELTSLAKKIIVFTCAYHNISHEEAIELLKRENILIETSEGLLHVSSSDIKRIFETIAKKIL
jgi:hypothetical protein